MRTTRLLALAVLAALPAVASAMGKGHGGGKPGPVACPPDGDVLAAIAAACPCDGRVMPDSSVVVWRNHGQYVSCVVRYRNRLRKAGCFADEAERRQVARCAAHASCGKDGAVLCCTYESGTCSDPAPGNLVAEGTCSNDATVPCDTAADCTKSSGRVTRTADACTADGGVAVGSGGPCTPCPPPPPAS